MGGKFNREDRYRIVFGVTEPPGIHRQTFLRGQAVLELLHIEGDFDDPARHAIWLTPEMFAHSLSLALLKTADARPTPEWLRQRSRVWRDLYAPEMTWFTLSDKGHVTIVLDRHQQYHVATDVPPPDLAEDIWTRPPGSLHRLPGTIDIRLDDQFGLTHRHQPLWLDTGMFGHPLTESDIRAAVSADLPLEPSPAWRILYVHDATVTTESGDDVKVLLLLGSDDRYYLPQMIPRRCLRPDPWPSLAVVNRALRPPEERTVTE